MPDINLVYRKSTTPTTNGATAFKGSPLTNDELDNNFYGINVEMLTKAPINNAVFTGSTTIPNIIASGGTINGTIIGGTTPVAGTFTTLTTTGNLTVGDATGDILSVRAGTALLPALTTAGDLNTGMWFPAADTIAWSTNGAERLRLADVGATIANNLTVTGDVAVNGGDLTTSATTFNLLDATTTTLNLARAATAITLGATTGTTTVRNNISVTGTGSIGGATSIGGAATLSSTLAVTGATTLSSTLGVTGVSTLNSAIVTTSATVGTTLGVTGAATLSSTLGVTGAATLSSTLAVTGAATLSSTLAVTGAATLSSTLGVTGNVAVNTDKFNVTAASGNTSIAGTLAVSGATTLSSTLGVTGNVAVATNKFTVASATGNTSIAGTLNVAGDTSLGILAAGSTSVSSITSSAGVQGTVLTSTTAIGTAPLVVTSTTKVTNLNADRVDNITFNAPTNAGGIPYVNSIAGTDYTVAFITDASSGAVLVAGGSGAPSWIAPSGFSAGSSYGATHISNGNNGELLYQRSSSVSLTTTPNSNIASVPSVATSGIKVGQLIIGNTNILGATYVTTINTSNNTITMSEVADPLGLGGTSTTKFLSTDKLSLGTSGQVLIASADAPAWSNNISISGSLTHGGLSPSAGTGIDQLYTVTDSLTLNTTGWFNTSVNSTELTTGSYMVQINTGTEYYTGIMSWYSPDVNSAVTDEIILHRASSGTESSNLYLRVERTDDGASPDMTVQISSSATRTAANYTLKFRRML